MSSDVVPDEERSLHERDLFQQRVDELKKVLDELDIKVGDYLLNDDGSLLRVREISKTHIELDHQYNDGTWGHYGSILGREWNNRRYARLPRDKDPEEAMRELLLQAVNVTTETPQPSSDDTGLILMGEESLRQRKLMLNQQKNMYAAMEALLNKKRHEMMSIRNKLQGQISKISEAIWTIELYLGIHEDVHHLKRGNTAEYWEPIHLFQLMLYMDEEVGVTSEYDDGIDYERIEQFDEWLLKDDHFKLIIPVERGIRIMRIRRNEKDYGNPWINFIKAGENNRTYILIRNGENLYRIWTNINMSPRLFPKEGEIEPNPDRVTFGTTTEKEYLQGIIDSYNKNTMVIQGILDRSHILRPYRGHINMFETSTWGKMIKLIRDDEDYIVTDGRPIWRKFLKKLNESVRRGSRIMITKPRAYYERGDNLWRWGGDRIWAPNPPAFGSVLNVEELIEGEYETTFYKILYDPGDEIWDPRAKEDNEYWYGAYRKRKRRVSYLLYDDEFINYDAIGLSDIDYYINERRMRGDYLSMLPVMKRIKKLKLQEMEEEENFVKLLKSNLGDELEDEIRKAIEWWKFKVIFKRPLLSEDAKAVRMITSRVKKVRKEDVPSS